MDIEQGEVKPVKNDRFYYVLFPNRQEALRLVKKAKMEEIPCAVVPTPKETGSLCGMALRITEENLPLLRKVIRLGSYKIERIARLPEEHGN